MNIKSKTKAFTLVELSIVIVIIGLLVGGVTAGMSVVKQAQLRSITSDINKYSVVTNAFKLQYNALPGDMKNADANAYFGVNGGNGNRSIELLPTATVMEDKQIWQHLNLAKLIPGNFRGNNPGGSIIYTLGYDIPAGPIKNSGYWYATATTGGGSIHGYYGHNIELASIDPNNQGYPSGAILTPSEAYNIDKKTDDGEPNLGKIMALDGTNIGGCISGTYALSVTTTSCRMFFWMK